MANFLCILPHTVIYLDNPFSLLRVNTQVYRNISNSKKLIFRYRSRTSHDKNESNIKKMLVRFNFYKLYIEGIDILKNTDLQYMKNIHTLEIEGRHITDEGLKCLSGINCLILENNQYISNNGLKFLANIQTLILPQNTMITDDGLKYITGIQYLNLDNNERITNAGIQYLHGIKILDIKLCTNITSCVFEHIQGTQLRNFTFAYDSFIVSNGLTFI